MTEADQQKYRQLVDELGKIREPLFFKSSRLVKPQNREDVSTLNISKEKEEVDVGTIPEKGNSQTEHCSTDSSKFCAIVVIVQFFFLRKGFKMFVNKVIDHISSISWIAGDSILSVIFRKYTAYCCKS